MTTMPMLLIVDDDAEIREQMKWALASQYEIVEAGSRAEAVAAFEQAHPELVTLDLGLPPFQDDVKEGLHTLETLLMADPLVKVVVITGNSERATALSAVKFGAYDFLQKPVQIDALRIILERARHLSSIERENRALQARLVTHGDQDIAGMSAGIRKALDVIRKVATTDISVLILGESGTGKELAARSLHRHSLRAHGPFIAINCGAIPEALMESELFGHEKGSFTGAHLQRIGRVEMAQGGTLFLDEIGDLSLPLQVKLLRFLQEHQIERVGGRETRTIDARVVAATNNDLQKAIREGKFREDLYYRLSGVTVSLPPLHTREGDVLLLAQMFLQRFAAQHQKTISGFSKSAIRALEGYRWPGNVRELENRVNRAVVMASGKYIGHEDLELESWVDMRPSGGLKEAREAVERKLIEAALAHHKGNVSRTAEDLGVTRPTLYELMSKLAIKNE